MTGGEAGLTRLDGQRIIVTGGASGLGATLVEHLPRLGARLVSIDMNEEAGREVAERSGADFIAGDVTSAESISSAVDAGVSRMGGLDCVVHAAGIAPMGKPHETDAALWESVMRVNALGTVLVNNAAFAHMRNTGGRILNLASVAGVVGVPFKAAYSMSKGAVITWSRVAATSWAGYGVTVNMIAPAIWTPMFDRTRQELGSEELARHEEDWRRQIPIGGRLGDPVDDFLPVLAFYCSPGARFQTGQLIPVDGGMLMTR